MPKNIISEIYGLVKTRGNREQFSLFTVVMGGMSLLPCWSPLEILRHLLSFSRLLFPGGWPPVQAGRACGGPGISLVRSTVLWAECQGSWYLYPKPAPAAPSPHQELSVLLSTQGLKCLGTTSSHRP